MWIFYTSLSLFFTSLQLFVSFFHKFLPFFALVCNFLSVFSLVCHFCDFFSQAYNIFFNSLSFFVPFFLHVCEFFSLVCHFFLLFFTLFVTFFDYPASKYWSQNVLRMTHNNVPKTFFKDPIRPSSGGLPNLTSWGCLRMTSNGRPREVDSGRPQDVLRTSTKWPWKHVLRTMFGVSFNGLAKWYITER